MALRQRVRACVREREGETEGVCVCVCESSLWKVSTLQA